MLRTTKAMAVLVLGVALPCAAQNRATHRLSKPDVVVADPFISVTAVRELRDGRLIVLDYLDSKVLLLDANFATATPIGREGNGPGEYAIPHRLFRLGGDSSAVSDYANTRLLIITPDAKPGGFLTTRLGNSCGDRSPNFRAVRATDSRGRFYAEAPPVEIRKGKLEPSDSAAIERWSAECTVDTVAFVPNPLGRAGSMVVGGFVVGKPRAVAPFRASAQWVVAGSGRVAVVRPEPYSVTFIDPDGMRLVGPPIRFSPVRVTNEVKQHWRDERRRPVPVLTTFRAGGGRISMEKPPYEEPLRWPEYLPPFLENAARFDEKDRLWVERAVGPRDPPTYDVIDRTGKLLMQVHLRQASRVVGFGRGVAYIVRRDDNDFAYLERYRIPGR